MSNRTKLARTILRRPDENIHRFCNGLQPSQPIRQNPPSSVKNSLKGCGKRCFHSWLAAYNDTCSLTGRRTAKPTILAQEDICSNPRPSETRHHCTSRTTASFRYKTSVAE